MGTMSNICENIKFLRKQSGLTQAGFAEKIGVKRPVVGAYEEGRAEPKLNTLQTIAEAFGFSIDTLISKKLEDLSAEELEKSGVDVSGSNLRILAITTGEDENENVELVPHKASAGYMNGFSDPEYLQELPKLYLPMLSVGTHRGFEIKGDSMLPLLPGTVVVGGYVDDWHDIKDGKTYVVVTKNDGLVYKRVYNQIFDKQSLKLVSDNKSYEAYEIPIDDVLEVWEAKMYISSEFPDAGQGADVDQLAQTVMQLQQEVMKMKKD